MNTQQKIYLVGVTASATASALVVAAIYEERMRKLKNELAAEKFSSDVLINAFANASKHMTKQEFNDVLFTALDRAKFDRIVKNLKK
jgi:hypothetical protein